ncbi:hypothetical protein NCTGTJJY_CDS0250 [Serratia phage 92A1]|nr:hypothetical protein NCTGTJJY_CDS0250 [Serratia phage 92A1]
MKEYYIYMKFSGQPERLLTTAHLKEVPITRKNNPRLYWLMEGIQIGTAFAPKNYTSVEYRYEEVK